MENSENENYRILTEYTESERGRERETKSGIWSGSMQQSQLLGCHVRGNRKPPRFPVTYIRSIRTAMLSRKSILNVQPSASCVRVTCYSQKKNIGKGGGKKRWLSRGEFYTGKWKKLKCDKKKMDWNGGQKSLSRETFFDCHFSFSFNLFFFFFDLLRL